jgi:hypothetical protein
VSTRSIRRNATIASEREAARARAVAAASLAPTVNADGHTGARVAVSIRF